MKRQHHINESPGVCGFVLCFALACASACAAGADAPSAANPPAIRFVDVTDELGLGGINPHEVAWGDFDNDGWVDLYAAGQLWRNDAGEHFTQVENLPLKGIGIWGDFDNDGRADLFCWPEPSGLYRNVDGKGFEDVTNRLAKLSKTVVRSRGATWADLNGDGSLDLYVGGYETIENSTYLPDAMYHSDGKGGFVMVALNRSAPQPARGIAAADFDEDGDLDVYVSNYRLAPNLLLLNDGKGHLKDVAGEYGVAGDGGLGAWGHTIGSAWGDLDNDGHLDLFVGNFSHAAAYQDRPKFYRNLGPQKGFRFQDKSDGAGLAWQESFASPTLGDFDNDGDLDLLFSTVYPGDHNVLYLNEGNWKFVDITASTGISKGPTYQAALADFDNDGDLDLVLAARLYRNDVQGAHWLKVRLIGDGKSVSTDAIGAQVRIRLGEKTLTRQVENATGEGNQNDSIVHFGLGSHDRAVTLELHWPDGTPQTVTTECDRTITVKYPPAR